MVYLYTCEEKPKTGGNVYFIRDNLGHIKIGLEKDVNKRKKELQTANPCELEVFCVLHVPKYFDAQRIEHELHEKFSNIRMAGEWFLEDEVIKYLRKGNIEISGYKFENITW